MLLERIEKVAWEKQLFTVIKNKFLAESISQDILIRSLHRIESKENVHDIITWLLYRDMAYNIEIMPKYEAIRLAENFLSFFKNDAIYLSNADWISSEDTWEWSYAKMKGWSGITNSTFDAGIILYDDKKIGIVWIEDED